jgi:hypothetical protein
VKDKETIAHPGNAVMMTMGPKGRNVVLDKSFAPRITKDSVIVAKEIELASKVANGCASSMMAKASRCWPESHRSSQRTSRPARRSIQAEIARPRGSQNAKPHHLNSETNTNKVRALWVTKCDFSCDGHGGLAGGIFRGDE